MIELEGFGDISANKIAEAIVVITGKLSKSLESIGYKVTNSVSKNTTFLLCGDVNSTKAKRARYKNNN